MTATSICPTGAVTLQPHDSRGTRDSGVAVQQRPAPGLHPRHVTDLKASGLSDETIQLCGLYSASDDQVKAILGFNAGPGLAIPYRSLNGKNGFTRIKPNVPFLDRYGKPSKYLTPKGAGNRLYIPPLIPAEQVRDCKTPLFITEGEKKAIKACQEGLCCIAVPGVWSWKQRNGNHSVPIPDLDLIDWKYRTVYLVFDSDLRAKREVASALYELNKELERRGAHVRKIDLPDGPQGKKCGLDDYLFTHSVETFCSLPHSPVLPPEFAYIEISPVTEFIRKTLPNREPIIGRGLLYPKSKLGLTGPGKKGKSMLIQNLMLSLAAGIPFLEDFYIPQSRRVVLIQSEVSPHAMQDRLRKMIDARENDRLKFQSAMLVNAPNLKIDSKEGYRTIQMILEQSKAEVVIFDPLYRLHTADENKAQEMRAVVDLFDRLIEEFGISLIMSHHHGKGTEGKDPGQFARGSTIFGDWVDTQLVLQADGSHDEGKRRLSFILRNDVEPDPYSICLNPETLWYEVNRIAAEDRPDAKRAADVAMRLSMAGKEVTAGNVSRELLCSKPTARDLLRLLPTDKWEGIPGPNRTVIYRHKRVENDPSKNDEAIFNLASGKSDQKASLYD
jgi:hypothetical protein